MIPRVAAAKVLSNRSPSATHALETWCIDEADAIARVTAALERDGWTAIRTRHDTASSERGARISIAATKGDVRFSGQTGGGDTRCAGTYVTATVMRLGAVDR